MFWTTIDHFVIYSKEYRWIWRWSGYTNAGLDWVFVRLSEAGWLWWCDDSQDRVRWLNGNLCTLPNQIFIHHTRAIVIDSIRRGTKFWRHMDSLPPLHWRFFFDLNLMNDAEQSHSTDIGMFYFIHILGRIGGKVLVWYRRWLEFPTSWIASEVVKMRCLRRPKKRQTYGYEDNPQTTSPNTPSLCRSITWNRSAIDSHQPARMYSKTVRITWLTSLQHPDDTEWWHWISVLRQVPGSSAKLTIGCAGCE